MYPFGLSDFIREFMNFMLKCPKLDCYRSMWIPGSSGEVEFYEFCLYVRKVMKKVNLPDTIQEENHVTKLCEQLSRLIGRQGVTLKNHKLNLEAHIAVPDSKYQLLIFLMRESPKFLFELEVKGKSKNQQNAKKSGDNIFEVMKAQPLKRKRKNLGNDNDGQPTKKKGRGDKQKEENIEVPSTSTSKKSNNDHRVIASCSKKVNFNEQSTKKVEDNSSLNGDDDDDDDDNIVKELSGYIEQISNNKAVCSNKAAEEITEELFARDMPTLTDEDTEQEQEEEEQEEEEQEEEEEEEEQESGSGSEGECTNDGDDNFEDSIKRMKNKTQSVKNIKVLDSNFEDSKRKAVHLGAVLTKLGTYIGKTDKMLESFKKSKNDIKTEEEKAKKAEAAAQQKVLRKMKTQTKTLFNLCDIVLDFAGTINEPLKDCKHCKMHCLTGLTKDLPSKQQINKSLSKKKNKK